MVKLQRKSHIISSTYHYSYHQPYFGIMIISIPVFNKKKRDYLILMYHLGLEYLFLKSFMLFNINCE